MSANPLLLPAKKDADTIRKEVLTNIVKMLTYRKWLSGDKKQKNIDMLLKLHESSGTDDTVYKLQLDVDLRTIPFYEFQQDPKDATDKSNIFDGKTIVIKIVQQKVTGVNKTPVISEFLTTYKNCHKILVVDSISEKPRHQLETTLYTEVFEESNFMINLTEHSASPQYEVLTPEETDAFLAEYQVTKRKLSKLEDTDAASKYLYLKKGQIVRILRNSEGSGGSVGYRVVIHKGIAKL